MINNHAFNESEYLDFFGLHCNPFPVTPDSNNFYSTRHIEQIVVEIMHGIITRKGFMVITGEVGLGKTTISRKILSLLNEYDIESSVVLHPIYKNSELLKEINQDFGIQCDSQLLSDQMKSLSKFLIRQHKLQKNCVIIIDDAQNLTFKNFELIRMLSNLESNTQKLVQILLIGQPELSDQLNSYELRQLKSRIIIHKKAAPLSRKDINDYITYKLNASGNSGKTRFSGNAINKISKFTNGNFRSINILMDRCLYSSFLSNSPTITKNNISEAIIDLNQTDNLESIKVNKYVPILFFLLFFIAGIGYVVLDNQNFIYKPVEVEAVAPPKIKPEKQKETTAPVTIARDNIYTVNNTPDSIVSFLTSYNLSKFDDKFYSAIKNNNLDNLKEEILTNSNLLLIKLDNIPEHIKTNFDILTFPDNNKETFSHYLFWQPEFRIKDFYYFHKSDTIGKLQKALIQTKFYRYKKDNIVGKRLMLSVLNFQKKTGLPKTGFPDDNTVFLLKHYNRKG